VATRPGLAYGTQSEGAHGYDDSTAIWSGPWAADQSAEGVIYLTAAFNGAKEFEIRLRSAISAHRNTGYEVLLGLPDGGGPYTQIMRWNGPPGDFTPLNATKVNPLTTPRTGDRWKAKIVGNTITAYLNDVLILQATDSTYSSGAPGFGFFTRPPTLNSQFGFSSITLTELGVANGDTTAPSVSMTSPTAGATLSGTVNVGANASDNVGVVGVQFKLDGANLGAEDTSAPYAVAWDTRSASNAAHTLTAVARDAAGNATTAASVNVTVNNSGGGTAPVPAGYWKFDDGAGLTAFDSSGGNHRGTLVNGPVWTSGRIGSNALQFNATDNGNDNDDPGVVIGRNFDAVVPLTLAAWINPTDYRDWRGIISKRDSFTASEMRWDWSLTVNSGLVYVVDNATIRTFPYAPPTGVWTHLALVATAADTRLYVNGVLQSTIAPLQLGTDGNANVVIGGTGEGPGGDNDPFKGSIDEVRVYRQALSSSDVLAIYNSTDASISQETSAPAVSIVSTDGFVDGPSLPVSSSAATDATSSPGAGTVVIPHVAGGGGWTTQIVLGNPTDNVMEGTIEFRDDRGGLAQLTIDGQPANSAAYIIAPRSSRKFVANGALPQTTTAAAHIIPRGNGVSPVTGAIVTYRPAGITLTEASVPAIGGTDFVTFVEESASSQSAEKVQSAIVIANKTALPTTVTLALTKMDGTPTDLIVTRSLPPLGRLAMFLDELFRDQLTNPFLGLLKITSQSSEVAVVGIRSHYNERGEFLITTIAPERKQGP
jgi:hypothetical protein